jgi:hypothetical protein
LMLVACSGDPKVASEKSFEAALQKYADKEGSQCFAHQAKFPLTHTAYGDEDGIFKNMSALKAAGLVDIKELEVKEQPDYSKRPPGKVAIRKLEIQLTDEGKKAFTEKLDGAKVRAFGGGAFCFGKKTIVKVERFTEPSDAMGIKMSQVNYTYRIDDVPSWAKHEAVGKQFPEVAKAVGSSKEPLQGKAAVVLTNQGWIHEREMR